MKLIFQFLIVFAAVAAQAASNTNIEPIKDFVLPTFTPEGYRSMLLRGTEARMLTPRLIELENMHLTVFSGTAANLLDTILLSPAARVSVDDNTVSGPGPMRLIRDDLDLTGEQWIYNRNQKKISIAKNVRVVFHTELKDLLR